MIPFSPPRIDDEICNEVVKVLKSGWITTGPRTKEFEKEISAYCGNHTTVCLNSATAGLELMLRWFGVGHTDQVILPAYTYAATANVIIHCGATPVFVDVNPDDFNMNVALIEEAINEKTKVILPVDFAGLPCRYDQIVAIAEKHRKKFRSATPEQEKLGRVMVLSDGAHSFGATLNGCKTGTLADATVFSFHAVKNLTTAEGGAVALNLPATFDHAEVYRALCIKSLHGQDKDALAKTRKGNWKYDIIEAGYKCNMTDIAAAIGQVELRRYDKDTLLKRKQIIEAYDVAFSGDDRFQLPVHKTADRTSSYHLYPLRLRDVTETQRDEIIREIFEREVSVNVHFLPLPATTFYRNLNYKVEEYPVALDNYSREISLPVYYDLTSAQVQQVVDAVFSAVKAVC